MQKFTAFLSKRQVGIKYLRYLQFKMYNNEDLVCEGVLTLKNDSYDEILNLKNNVIFNIIHKKEKAKQKNSR